MALAEFMHSLFADGRVAVPPLARFDPDDISAAGAWLAEFETIYRGEMPGTAPPFSLAAGLWAAQKFFRAAQFAVYRDHGPQELAAELGDDISDDGSAGIHYSVDLTFRFLPDLIRLARSASTGDPLVARLQEWARQWPLSSVGLQAIEGISSARFSSDPCLMQLYADRIVASQDHARLSDANLRAVVRANLGNFAELSPATFEKLNCEKTSEEPV